MLSTTVSTLLGLPYAYSTVTCDLPSGRIKERRPDFLTSAMRLVSLCARAMGMGISSSVSSQA